MMKCLKTQLPSVNDMRRGRFESIKQRGDSFLTINERS